jgi:hypothetical protein
MKIILVIWPIEGNDIISSASIIALSLIRRNQPITKKQKMSGSREAQGMRERRKEFWVRLIVPFWQKTLENLANANAMSKS